MAKNRSRMRGNSKSTSQRLHVSSFVPNKNEFTYYSKPISTFQPRARPVNAPARSYLRQKSAIRSLRYANPTFGRFALVPQRFTDLHYSIPTSRIALETARRALICAGRHSRREVMHAMGLAGRPWILLKKLAGTGGGVTEPRWTPESFVRCS